MASRIIYPGQCHCNGTTEAKAKDTADRIRIECIHFTLDGFWVERGRNGIPLTKIVLEYEVDNMREIANYCYEHLFTLALQGPIGDGSEEDLRSAYLDIILKIANPEERMAILRNMGFVEWLNEKAAKMQNLPKCENKACNKQGHMVKCKGCNKMFCNTTCQRQHHGGKSCVTLGKIK